MNTPTTPRVWDSGPQPGRDVDTVRDVDGDLWERWVTRLNVLSLFSGVGGLELGLERVGMTVVGQVELDPFCRSVLTKHWPEVPKHDDVRTCVDWWRGEPRPPVHVVAGGVPCQPFSIRGERRGIADERWGWPWMFDTVREMEPDYVLMECVAALLRDRDAFGWILSDLASIGYDAEWDCVPAASVGANHERDRFFLLAYPGRERRREGPRQLGRLGSARRGAAVADADGERRERWGRPGGLDAGWPQPSYCDWWRTEPDVGRVAHGVPSRVDRIRALGNAVVPQVGEHIGRLIVAADRSEVAA